jgi:thioredoxin-dependent peroxiredoxin
MLKAAAGLFAAMFALRLFVPAGAAFDSLKAGDPAPDFSLPGTDGTTHSLSGLKGRWVVLAWFPKAFTGG